MLRGYFLLLSSSVQNSITALSVGEPKYRFTLYPLTKSYLKVYRTMYMWAKINVLVGPDKTKAIYRESVISHPM